MYGDSKKVRIRKTDLFPNFCWKILIILNLKPFFFLENMKTALSGKVPSREVEVKFMKLIGRESIGNLENILSVFDDSCEDNFNKKEFVGLATTGGHRETDVTYTIICFNKVDGRLQLI